MATDCSHSLALGNDITLQGVQVRPGFGAGNLFAIGSSLKAEPAAGFYGLVLLGFNNAPAPLAGDLTMDNSPLLVVGNGTSDSARSNAMILEKSGRLTLTHRAYVATTPGANPAQPETLVVEGSSTLKGGLAVSGPVTFVRQGDIGMGDFGLPADQGPVN